METLFSKIIAGRIPSYKILEDERFYAFLDIAPLREGHTLVVPKVAVDNLWDVGDEHLQHWLTFARPIAKAIEQAFPCNRCGISVMGLEVPHAHMHLLPISNARDLDFTQPKKQMASEELEAVQRRILGALNR